METFKLKLQFTKKKKNKRKKIKKYSICKYLMCVTSTNQQIVNS